MDYVILEAGPELRLQHECDLSVRDPQVQDGRKTSTSDGKSWKLVCGIYFQFLQLLHERTLREDPPICKYPRHFQEITISDL